MRRETQNVLLLLLGGALLKIAITGDYLRYVKPSQQPWVLGGGAVMVLLGTVAIVRDIRAARTRGAPAHAEHHHPARAAWLLLVPVLAVFLVAPPALGSDSVTRTTASAPTGGYVPSGSGPTFAPLPAGGVVRLSVTDFVTRAGWDSEGSLKGRTVSLSGFVVHSRGRTLLARLVIGCCAADAFPVRVQLIGGQADALPDDTWIEVKGTLVPGKGKTEFSYTPHLAVTSLREIPQPPDPYEY